MRASSKLAMTRMSVPLLQLSGKEFHVAYTFELTAGIGRQGMDTGRKRHHHRDHGIRDRMGHLGVAPKQDASFGPAYLISDRCAGASQTVVLGLEAAR